MMLISERDMIQIKGGATSIGTVINSISKLINVVLDLGRIVGSSIRYTKNKQMCR